MTLEQLAVVHDALEEAGLSPAQVSRAIHAIDAEEIEAHIDAIQVNTGGWGLDFTCTRASLVIMGSAHNVLGLGRVVLLKLPEKPSPSEPS